MLTINFDAGKEHWLGLETMHLLTKAKVYNLRIRLTSVSGKKGVGGYGIFRVKSEVSGHRKYKWHVDVQCILQPGGGIRS